MPNFELVASAVVIAISNGHTTTPLKCYGCIFVMLRTVTRLGPVWQRPGVGTGICPVSKQPLGTGFPRYRRAAKTGAFGRPSGTVACKRPYQPERLWYRHRTSTLSFATAHKPPKAKKFFSTAALFPRTDFCFILLFLYIVFLVVVRRKGDCGEVKARSRYRKKDDCVKATTILVTVRRKGDFGEVAIPTPILGERYQTLEPHYIEHRYRPTKRPPGITDTDPQFGLILGATTGPYTLVKRLPFDAIKMKASVELTIRGASERRERSPGRLHRAYIHTTMPDDKNAVHVAEPGDPIRAAVPRLFSSYRTATLISADRCKKKKTHLNLSRSCLFTISSERTYIEHCSA
jgi:hypothetical protein